MLGSYKNRKRKRKNIYEETAFAPIKQMYEGIITQCNENKHLLNQKYFLNDFKNIKYKMKLVVPLMTIYD